MNDRNPDHRTTARPMVALVGLLIALGLLGACSPAESADPEPSSAEVAAANDALACADVWTPSTEAGIPLGADAELVSARQAQRVATYVDEDVEEAGEAAGRAMDRCAELGHAHPTP